MDHRADSFAYATRAALHIRQINRHGVDVGGIGIGDTIVYQIGPNVQPAFGKVEGIRRGYDNKIAAVNVMVYASPPKAIHVNYVLAKLARYVPSKVSQSPSEVAFITAARAAGRKIYSVMKNQVDEGADWQECKGNFAFNFSSLLYKVVDDHGNTITEQGAEWGANNQMERS